MAAKEEEMPCWAQWVSSVLAAILVAFIAGVTAHFAGVSYDTKVLMMWVSGTVVMYQSKHRQR